MATDFLPINGTDHIEFYVGNAKQASIFYRAAFGFRLTGYRGPETGVRDRASYLLEPAANGTTLTNKWDLQPTSASLRLLGPLAIPKVRSAVAENLRTLKQILENVRG